jgi:hypothetical protein
VNLAGDKLVSLREICPEASLISDGGKEYVFLPGLKITTDGKVVVVDALLRPGEHSGYNTRLFLAEPLPSKGRGGGWSVHAILGRTWHTWSWRNVPETLPLPQMLLEHLWALR